MVRHPQPGHLRCHMKTLRLILLIVLLQGFCYSFVSAQEPVKISELKGITDSAGVAHLFYRIYSQWDNGYSNHIYHYDTATKSDSVYLRDASGPLLPGEYSHTRVKEITFFNSNPRKHIGLFEFCDMDCGESITRYDFYGWGGTFQEFDYLLPAGDENSRVYVRHNQSTTVISYDGGKTWPDFFEINSGSFPDSLILDFPLIALSPYDPDLMFGMDPDAESVLLRSTDAGQSRESVEAPFRLLNRHIYFDSDGQHIYAAGIQNETIVLYTSTQRGEPGSWQFLRALESEPVLRTDPGNHGHLYLVEGNTILQSTDYGETFSSCHEHTLPVTGLYKGKADNELFFTTDKRLYALRSGEEELIREILVSPDPEPQRIWFDLSLGTERHYHDCGGMTGLCLPMEGINRLATEKIIGETEIDSKIWAEVVWTYTRDFWSEDPEAFVVYDTVFYRTDGPLLYQHMAGGDSLIFDFGFEKGDSLLRHFLPFIPGDQDPEEYVNFNYLYVNGDLPSVVLFDTTITFPDGLHRRIVWGDDTLRTQFGDYYPIIEASVFVDSLVTQWNLPLPRNFLRPFYYIEGMGVMKTPVNHRHMNMSGFRTSSGTEFGWMNDIPVSIYDDPERPTGFTLHQNYPNPFNPSTTIRYTLPEAGQVRLEVFDVTGRRVALLRDQLMPSGSYSDIFDATMLSSGVYLYRLSYSGQVLVKKMVLLN
jgi:hypothetical protein